MVGGIMVDDCYDGAYGYADDGNDGAVVIVTQL